MNSSLHIKLACSNQPPTNSLTSIKGCTMGRCMFKALLSAEPWALSKQHQRFLWIALWGVCQHLYQESRSSHLFAWQGHGHSHCTVLWLCRQVEMHSFDTQIYMLEIMVSFHFVVNMWVGSLFWNQCCRVQTSWSLGRFIQVTVDSAGLKYYILILLSRPVPETLRLPCSICSLSSLICDKDMQRTTSTAAEICGLQKQ